MNQLTEELRAMATALGFSLAGVCRARELDEFGRLVEWLEAGYGGRMEYLERRRDAYRHPRGVLEGVRSVLMLAMPYRTGEPQPAPAGSGRVSRYAWGQRDYHDVIRERLAVLKQFLLDVHPEARVRGVVDTAPLMERQLARQAGLGWIGKNTLLLNPRAGSWFFLAALLTDLELAEDQPFETDHCGTCRACLDACPTQAFPQPYVLDATRCISYLTIELREPIPDELRPGIGHWLFGCDVCQEVCPWNRRVPGDGEPAFVPRADLDPVDLGELFSLSDQQFRERFGSSPLWRARRRGLLRNAAIVLGNQRPPGAVDALRRGLHDPEPLVRSACAWALRRCEPAVP